MSDKTMLQIENLIAGVIIGGAIGVVMYYALALWGMLV